MNFFQKIIDYFRKRSEYKKKQREWASRFDGPPAKPDNLLPLDPDDPWKT